MTKASKPLYRPFKSAVKHKKYSVYVKGDSGAKKLIHFGDNWYPQYKDKIGDYKKLDTNDLKRRKAYYSRHGKSNDKNSAKYWAQRVLW